MPKKLAKNEEKLWARRAGWHNLIHASQYQIHLLKSGNFNFKLSQRNLALFPDFFELKLASGPYL